MIKTVSNLTKKSFHHYTGPAVDSEFKEKNIVFGYNGRGKSALSIGILEEFLKDTEKTSANYRFFDRDYVEKNLLLEPSNQSIIKGVKANFGEKGVEIEKTIKALRNTLQETKDLSNEILILRKQTREEIDNIHNRRKGKSNINKKGASIDLFEVISLYEKDLQDAIKIEPDEEELINIKGDNKFEDLKQFVESIHIVQNETISDTDIARIKNLYFIKFDDIGIPTATVIQWLNEGLKFHKDSDTCMFCGNSFNFENVYLKIDAYNKNKKQQTVIEYTEFLLKLEKIHSNLDFFLHNMKTLAACLGQDIIKEAIESIENKKSKLYSQIQLLESKIHNWDNVNTLLDFDFLQVFRNILVEYTTIADIKKKELIALQDKIIHQSSLVKGAIGLEIKNNSFIRKCISDIKIKEETLKTILDNNKKVNDQIQKLQSEKSPTIDFALHINEILKTTGVELELTIEADNYLIKHHDTEISLSLEDISEGEINLLGLLFFYYELFSDKNQKDFKDTIELIIIDDPISSVDDINKMYVLELVKNILELERPQIFIFTHVWDDFCNLCYSRNDNTDTPYRFLEIEKSNEGSTIHKVKTKQTPYKHLFKEVYIFSQKSDYNNMTDCEIYHYPNSMRKILEEFLSFKVNKSTPTASNRKNIEKVLLGINTSNSSKTKLGILLDVCNILSHKASRNPNEIYNSARFLMNCIKTVDKIHFDSMIED